MSKSLFFIIFILLLLICVYFIYRLDLCKNKFRLLKNVLDRNTNETINLANRVDNLKSRETLCKLNYINNNSFEQFGNCKANPPSSEGSCEKPTCPPCQYPGSDNTCREPIPLEDYIKELKSKGDQDTLNALMRNIGDIGGGTCPSTSPPCTSEEERNQKTKQSFDKFDKMRKYAEDCQDDSIYNTMRPELQKGCPAIIKLVNQTNKKLQNKGLTPSGQSMDNNGGGKGGGKGGVDYEVTITILLMTILISIITTRILLLRKDQ